MGEMGGNGVGSHSLAESGLSGYDSVMPRRPRIATGGYVYHALNRAVGRSTIFEKVDDYAAFEAVLEEAREQVDMRLLAFCVMPNHWHLAHGTVGTGPLYQGRFKSFPIQEDEHFELVAPSQPERSRDTCRLASPPRPELAGVCHSSRDGGGMEGIAAERPGWHSLRRNGLAAGHGEASGIGIHVTSPWPPKTPPSRPVNGRTTRQIDTNETRPRFPVSVSHSISGPTG